MRNNWKVYRDLGIKFCIFALISLFLISAFASYYIAFNLNAKFNSAFNENRPVHSAETIIENLTFEYYNVEIMSQDFRFINCTFLSWVNIDSNITHGPSHVRFINCTFKNYINIYSHSNDSSEVIFTDSNLIGSSPFLNVYNDAVVMFWNESGENSIIARSYVYLYNNCTVIVNQTN
ncbi:MAG: hypothetical protein LUQ65_01130, partial [Candidatus Helarchaeota archaeon]|nr:hypothetical protein [Candidatus Helarchaeota archaeon]